MENRPPQQETPRRPPTNSGRKTNGSGGSPTPPWLWLLLLGRVRPDLLAVRAQDRDPGHLLPLVLRAGRERQYQEHLDPGDRDPRRAAQGDGTIRTAPTQTDSHGHESSSPTLRPKPSIEPIVQKLIQLEREEDRRSEDGRRKKAGDAGQDRSASRPTRPTAWSGSCCSCRRSWSSSSST